MMVDVLSARPKRKRWYDFWNCIAIRLHTGDNEYVCECGFSCCAWNERNSIRINKLVASHGTLGINKSRHASHSGTVSAALWARESAGMHLHRYTVLCTALFFLLSPTLRSVFSSFLFFSFLVLQQNSNQNDMHSIHLGKMQWVGDIYAQAVVG